MSQPWTDDSAPRWVRADEPSILHIRQDQADLDGWGHALCGEGSFTWHRVDRLDGYTGSPCTVCTTVADVDTVGPVVLERTRTPTRHLADVRVASSERGPAGVWHGYRPGTSRTLCGRPLLELHLWAGLAWPEAAPVGEVCYSCALVAQTQL
jgi:hypothetical protein